jgi:hypothetical protein
MTEKSPRSNARGTPAASTSTPLICSMVSKRYGTSSVSYADANQVKFIHAHQMAKNTIR